jgi:hypothetical protein
MVARDTSGVLKRSQEEVEEVKEEEGEEEEEEVVVVVVVAYVDLHYLIRPLTSSSFSRTTDGGLRHTRAL